MKFRNFDFWSVTLKWVMIFNWNFLQKFAIFILFTMITMVPILTSMDVRTLLIISKKEFEKIDSEELFFMRIDQTTILFLFHD